ncbi:hypothetical protein J6590_034771 [Homalodisca vitripennis]|nr:hypothetical protein J6590_034771 [Homalodisca vitripennis]
MGEIVTVTLSQDPGCNNVVDGALSGSYQMEYGRESIQYRFDGIDNNSKSDILDHSAIGISQNKDKVRNEKNRTVGNDILNNLCVKGAICAVCHKHSFERIAHLLIAASQYSSRPLQVSSSELRWT